MKYSTHGVVLRSGCHDRVSLFLSAALPERRLRGARLRARQFDGTEAPVGHPDLQGIWNNSTTTPLERMTAEEQEVARRAAAPISTATEGHRAG